MSFKDYLLEMPHWGVSGMVINCPTGDTISGDKKEYHFDFAFEFLKDTELKRKLSMAMSPLLPKYKGILPFYNNVKDVLFMYDFNKNKAVEPNTVLLNKIRDAMLTHSDHKGKKIEIK
jgi:hypothetical protein